MADQDSEERAYVLGHRMALRQVLELCVRQLGYDDPGSTAVKWIAEREAAISALRRVCEDYGDNDWDERLHLADVITKHIVLT